MHQAHKRLAAISPHFDDAVFSCGKLLAATAESTVLTVFSAIPERGGRLTEWDRLCGFSSGEEAMRTRRQENKLALSLLGAHGVNLDFLDDQYSPREQAEQLTPRVAAGLTAALTKIHPDMVLMPMGLFHRDHAQTFEAALTVWPLFDRCVWLAYGEALYRLKTGLLQQRLADLLGRRIQATPVFFADAHSIMKSRAVAAYASQLGPLGLVPGQGDDAAPECYWQMQWQAHA